MTQQPWRPGVDQRHARPGGAPREKLEAVRVRVLGGFFVTVGRRAIGEDGWRLRKAASLMKILAIEPGHRMHREQAMDLLWPASDPKAAANGHPARRVIHKQTRKGNRFPVRVSTQSPAQRGCVRKIL